jgi:hypothetical protein
LVERLVRNEKVRGSNPLISTTTNQKQERLAGLGINNPWLPMEGAKNDFFFAATQENPCRTRMTAANSQFSFRLSNTQEEITREV